MPRVNPQPISAPKSTQGKRYKVFVSYSHINTAAARQFLESFRLILPLPEYRDLEIEPEQVFFDRDRIYAGDSWGDSIHKAIEDDPCFVILISKDSLSSDSCLRELGTAAGRGLPIVPIILNPCKWEKRGIRDDIRMRKLGSFDAIPKDGNSHLLPITEWPEASRTDVWKVVVQQLVGRLRRDNKEKLDRSHPSVDQDVLRSTQQRKVPPISYFCDQTKPVEQFNLGVKTWTGKALMVLTRGISDDHVPRFWDRLRNKNLKDYLTACNEQLLEARPFVWPETISDVESLRSMMMRAFSESLTGKMYELTLANASLLGTKLAALPGVLPLFTILPNLPREDITTGLRVLLDLLEQCPAGVPLQRLVMAILLEDSAVTHEPDLAKVLNLAGYQRTHVVTLDPLQMIEKTDVRNWHLNYDVERLYQVDEDTLLQSLFDDSQVKSLRLGQFAKKVKEFF